MSLSTQLIAQLGHKSAPTRQAIAAGYRAIASQPDLLAEWSATFCQLTGWPEPSKRIDARQLAQVWGLADAAPDPLRLIFAAQTVYGLMVKMLVAHVLGLPLSDGGAIASGAVLRDAGVYGLGDARISAPRDARINAPRDARISAPSDGGPLGQMAAALDAESYAALAITIAGLDMSQPLAPDVLKGLYQDLFPPRLRHALGEYFTPDWLAAYLLDALAYDGSERLLDPACGTGTFLAHALRRMPPDLPVSDKLARLGGIDINPLAALATRANLLLALRHELKPGHDALHLPVLCGDAVLDPPDWGAFDVIAGNPPWINWESLPDAYRQATRTLWQAHGLFPHSGMDAILGSGKKDLAMLLTYTAADHFLRSGGRLGFIITQSAFKSAGAGEGFRRFPGLRVLGVDDLSALQPFRGAMTRAAIIRLKKGAGTVYPVPYRLWQRRPDAKPPQEDDSLAVVQQKTRCTDHQAAPIDPDDHASPWLSGHPGALAAVRALVGASDYDAHAGAYTGGANGVYWLEVLEERGDQVRVRNITEGSKRPVPTVEAWIEAGLVYPLLRGRDLRRWGAVPGAAILLVQDPVRQRGYDPDWLAAHYPLTLAYLQQFEPTLRQRAAYRRYFKASAPFYTMFDVGTYTLAPYKASWMGFGVLSMAAAVVGPVDGRPVITNQALHPFIGLEDEREAHYAAACLNSAPFNFAVISLAQVGGKSFAQPGTLRRLRVPRFDPASQVHQRLAEQSLMAHQQVQMGQSPDAAQAAIDVLAGQLWGLSSAELAAITASLDDLSG